MESSLIKQPKSTAKIASSIVTAPKALANLIAKIEKDIEKLPKNEKEKLLQRMSIDDESKALISENNCNDSSRSTSHSARLVESNLMAIRLELSEVLNQQAELRSKEKRLKLNIKKAQKAVSNKYEIDDKFQEEESLESIVGRLFKENAWQVSIMPQESSKLISSDSCPLWFLSRQAPEGDKVMDEKSLVVSRDAILIDPLPESKYQEQEKLTERSITRIINGIDILDDNDKSSLLSQLVGMISSSQQPASLKQDSKSISDTAAPSIDSVINVLLKLISAQQAGESFDAFHEQFKNELDTINIVDFESVSDFINKVEFWVSSALISKDHQAIKSVLRMLEEMAGRCFFFIGVESLEMDSIERATYLRLLGHITTALHDNSEKLVNYMLDMLMTAAPLEMHQGNLIESTREMTEERSASVIYDYNDFHGNSVAEINSAPEQQDESTKDTNRSPNSSRPNCRLASNVIDLVSSEKKRIKPAMKSPNSTLIDYSTYSIEASPLLSPVPSPLHVLSSPVRPNLSLYDRLKSKANAYSSVAVAKNNSQATSLNHAANDKIVDSTIIAQLRAKALDYGLTESDPDRLTQIFKAIDETEMGTQKASDDRQQNLPNKILPYYLPNNRGNAAKGSIVTKDELQQFIAENDDILQNIVTFEPIDIDSLYLRLRSAGKRIDKKTLLLHLDELNVFCSRPRR